MPAYVLVEIDVHDPQGYEEYKRIVPPIVARYGGRYLARGGRTLTLEGDWHPTRLVVLEFDSLEQAQTWWSSPEYEPVRRIRQRCARSRMIVVEGAAPPAGDPPR
jgi:uncharacterized protein (DUF1330 family)